ncbi:MAG TPA: hypothetical protein DCF62_01935 [Porticoccaceae bacterium]|nr:hypothetical protein [Porticoccaceae bacterium]HCO61522.1 hypothetical protein [Porticoccaceae bacterium]
MSSSLYEIVMLPDGEVVLQRANNEGEPLIRISFSDEAKFYLSDTTIDVAKAMIDAGIEAVEDLSNDAMAIEEEEAEEQRVLH